MESVAIIGAGASGLFCANLLDTDSYRITIFEKNNKAGKKLLATGNGRCNITNSYIQKENFHGHNYSFVNFALSQFDYHKCKKTFSQIGIEFFESDNGKVFPLSLQASSVVEQLKYTIESSLIQLKLDHPVKTIQQDGSNGFIINATEHFDKVILACGSNAMPKLGGSDLGYLLADQLSLKTTALFPSLVQLVSEDTNIAMANGLKIDAVVNGIRGDLLFTKYGISGNSVLDISREISQKLLHTDKVQITIDLFPSHSKEQLNTLLIKRLKTLSPRDIVLWFDGVIPHKLTRYLLKKTKLDHKNDSSQLNRKDIQTIVYALKSFQLTIVDTKGFETCEVTAGGIDTTQIDPQTMQVKNNPNLYITGELLDVDGDCGGYNLHFAWASAYLCAKHLSKGKKS
jgi:predicted Rossmann fold flavoprotein